MIKPAIIVLATIVLASLIARHVPGINGPWYWKWPWRNLPFAPLYTALLIAATPFIAAQMLYRRRRGDERGAFMAVTLLTLATLAISLTAMFVHTKPYGLSRLDATVQSPIVNSYYSDAVAIQRNIEENPNLSTRAALDDYPLLLPHLHLHSRYKPPGLMLYYLVWIKLFGPGEAAAAGGGIFIAILGALRVPAAFWMFASLTRNRDAAFNTASLLALAPGANLFLPTFDTIYPAIACVLIVLWARALARGRVVDASAFGALLALGLFLSYIFLVFGVFFVVYALMKIADEPRSMIRRAIIAGAIAAATIFACYGVLYAISGFDPIETARTISRLQMRDLIALRRPFPAHIFFDVLDFGLAAGWIVFGLIVFLFTPPHRALRRGSPAGRLVLLCLLQIATVALAALLPGEAARLWLPMLPLLLVPAGLELTRWPFAARVGVYACLWLMLAVLCQNFAFVFDPFQRPPPTAAAAVR